MADKNDFWIELTNDQHDALIGLVYDYYQGKILDELDMTHSCFDSCRVTAGGSVIIGNGNYLILSYYYHKSKIKTNAVNYDELPECILDIIDDNLCIVSYNGYRLYKRSCVDEFINGESTLYEALCNQTELEDIDVQDAKDCIHNIY